MAQDKPPNVMGGVTNNQGIVTQGQIGNNLIIQQQTNPYWRLTEEQKQKFGSALASIPKDKRFKVFLPGLMSSQQSQTLIADFAAALQQSGWEVMGITDLTLRPDLVGINVVVPNETKKIEDIPQNTRDLMGLLQAANIPFVLCPPGTATMWPGPTIAIGSRP